MKIPRNNLLKSGFIIQKIDKTESNNPVKWYPVIVIATELLILFCSPVIQPTINNPRVSRTKNNSGIENENKKDQFTSNRTIRFKKINTQSEKLTI